MYFALIGIIICLGISMLILSVDVMSLPQNNVFYPREYLENHTAFWSALNYSQEHQERGYILARKNNIPIHNPRQWEWDLGNHYVSNLENIVMHLGLLFGMMRTIDLLKHLMIENRRQSWRLFLEHIEHIDN